MAQCIVKKSPIHGKGVFATQYLAKGTILSCDVLPLSTGDPLISKYLFFYRGDSTCIHLGFASFLNSSEDPNLRHFKMDPEENLSYFEVIRDVLPDEELTLLYSVR
jgi:SET domain-containing protein